MAARSCGTDAEMLGSLSTCVCFLFSAPAIDPTFWVLVNSRNPKPHKSAQKTSPEYTRNLELESASNLVAKLIYESPYQEEEANRFFVDSARASQGEKAACLKSRTPSL